MTCLSNPEVVDGYLSTECMRGHMAGPYPEPPFENMRCSGIGVVPKKSGGFRLIMHLSAPTGNSINDGIDPEQFSLHYVTVDDALRLVNKHGRGALLAKVDMKHAFRICPVSPLDWPLLCIFWDGKYYVDKVLPFGLRSSPYLFNRLADAVAWIAVNRHNIADLLHYLDDYLTVAAPMDKRRAIAKFNKLISVFKALNIPLAEGDDKVCPPSTTVTFLGIEIDTVAWEIRLPQTKLEEILGLVSHWLTKRSCTKRELLSLAGSLSFAAKVVPPGRTFCRRLFTSASQLNSMDTAGPVPTDVKLDIQWWSACLGKWNGRNAVTPSDWTTAEDIGFFTDASGSHGYGMVFGPHWCYGSWPDSLKHESIEWKELFAVVLACLTWSTSLTNRRVLLYCDNEAVCHVWRTGVSRNSKVMDLIRAGLLINARNNCIVLIRHIRGHSNDLADALSRLQVTRFKDLHQQADSDPTTAALPDLIKLMTAPWSSSVKAWQGVQRQRMHQP